MEYRWRCKSRAYHRLCWPSKNFLRTGKNWFTRIKSWGLCSHILKSLNISRSLDELKRFPAILRPFICNCQVRNSNNRKPACKFLACTEAHALPKGKQWFQCFRRSSSTWVEVIIWQFLRRSGSRSGRQCHLLPCDCTCSGLWVNLNLTQWLSSDAVKLIPQQVPFYRKMFKDSRSYLFTANRRRSVLIARPEWHC